MAGSPSAGGSAASCTAQPSTTAPRPADRRAGPPVDCGHDDRLAYAVAPFPSPDNAVLRVVVGNAIASVRSGKASVEEAILHAAAHGWYEGHVQGEDECPGCDFRASYPNTATAADYPATPRTANNSSVALLVADIPQNRPNDCNRPRSASS